MKKGLTFFLVLIFISFVTISYFNTFEKMDNSMYDMIFQREREPIDNIFIVGIDSESIEELGSWPWPRAYMADMINTLTELNVAAIGVDVIYNSQNDHEEDALLVEAVKNAGNVIIPVSGQFRDRQTQAGTLEAVGLLEPFPLLKSVSTPGHINVIADNSDGLSLGIDSDGVVRKAIKSISYYGTTYDAFAIKIYEQYCKTMGIKSDTNITTNQFDQFHIQFVGPPKTFPMLSFSSVLNGDYPPEIFDGAIILIGPYNEGLGRDYYYTSIDTQAPMYGIEIHANILQNVLEKTYKSKLPVAMDILVLLLFAVLSFFIYLKINPYIGVFVMFGLVGVSILSANILYNCGYILQTFYIIVFIILLYFVSLIYRYLLELEQKKMVTDMFGRYLAPEVVTKLLREGRKGLELVVVGRELTVLFVDIRGFTTLSESATPENVVKILNKYLNLTATAVFNNQGTLDKFIGDATMAIYNAPEILENHELCAVRTAWEMQQKAKPIKEEIQNEFGVTLNFGIGINTGYAVVGNIGADFRMDYTAIGDTVNTAARLESNARQGEILISEATYEKVKDYVRVTSRGPISVKGKATQILVYQVDEVF